MGMKRKEHREVASIQGPEFSADASDCGNGWSAMNENQSKGGQTREHQTREHLTAKEISRWLVEGPEQSADQHLQNCWACQAKLAEAKAPLTAFRTAVVGWSEAQDVIRPRTALAKKNQRYGGIQVWLPATLALATLLLVGFLTGPGLLRGHGTVRQAVVDSSTPPDSDAALMDKVDTEVSEAVPDAMAPLTDLVAWDSNEGVAGTTAAPEKKATHKKSSPGTNAKARVHAAN